MFSWCHAPCFHFPRVVFSGFVFHALILYVSCSVSHFIFSLLMFSFFSVRVACFQLSWFSFHFLFIVFLFSCFQFLENRISGNKMTSGSSKITPTWPPGAPKWPETEPRSAAVELHTSENLAPGARSLFLTTLCSVLNDPGQLLVTSSPPPPAPGRRRGSPAGPPRQK